MIPPLRSHLIRRTTTTNTRNMKLKNPFFNPFYSADGDQQSVSTTCSTANHTPNSCRRPFATSTSTNMMMGNIMTSVGSALTSYKVMIPAIGLVSIFLMYKKYRTAIRKRLRQINEESWLFGAGLTMKRTNQPNNSTSFKHLMELDSTFVQQQHKEGKFSFTGLGDYLATLQPNNLPKGYTTKDLPDSIQREIEAGLARGLLTALGPNLGRALLPAVGLSPIKNQIKSVVTSIGTKWFVGKKGDNKTGSDQPKSVGSPSGDKGGIPVSLLTLMGISDLNAQANAGKQKKASTPDDVVEQDEHPGASITAIDKMKAGEVAAEHSFADLVPFDKPFVVMKDFNRTIENMEITLENSKKTPDHCSTELKMAQKEAMDREIVNGTPSEKEEEPGEAYDPDGRSMGDPVPVNPRLFPDLYFGYGDAQSSHTNREVLKMRLLSVVLNRLGSNYLTRSETNDEKQLFKVMMNENDKKYITKPSELIEALVDQGHEIRIIPTSRMTTFGIGLCVKEHDDRWTNIPMGVFLESGYENEAGEMAPAQMPHSGLDLYIKGPIAGGEIQGKPSELSIQHFIAIDEFCGWHSNQVPVMPDNESVHMGEVLTKKKDVARGARLAALYACSLNGLATEMQLPFGGYGATAVCNDSAAILQHCLYGDCGIFPMTSIGKYLQRTMRYMHRLGNNLKKVDGMTEESKDVDALIDGMVELPSDINASPGNLINAAQRMLRTSQPVESLMLQKDSKRVMKTILKEVQENKILASKFDTKNLQFASA